MPITTNTASAAIESTFKQYAERTRKIAIRRLQIIGEQCINAARLSGAYTDRTGNLRSSVGYVIVENGKVIFDNFQGTAEGQQNGKTFAQQLAAQFGGISLILVAGMQYAAYVHNRGKDVLTSAELLAEKLINELK